MSSAGEPGAPHGPGPCFWGCEECPEEARRLRAFFVELGGRPLAEVRREVEEVERRLGRPLSPETYEADLLELEQKERGAGGRGAPPV